MYRVGLAALILLTSSVHAADTSSKDMYQVIRQNDLPRLRSMLASGATANLRDSRGVTPLMYASAVGTADATQILIEAGADVNAKSAGAWPVAILEKPNSVSTKENVFERIGSLTGTCSTCGILRNRLIGGIG